MNALSTRLIKAIVIFSLSFRTNEFLVHEKQSQQSRVGVPHPQLRTAYTSVIEIGKVGLNPLWQRWNSSPFPASWMSALTTELLDTK